MVVEIQYSDGQISFKMSNNKPLDDKEKNNGTIFSPSIPIIPQDRLIKQAADIVRSGGVIVYPTDFCYALGCKLGDQKRDGAHSHDS